MSFKDLEQFIHVVEKILVQVIDNVPGKIVHNKLLAGPCSGKKVSCWLKTKGTLFKPLTNSGRQHPDLHLLHKP